MRIPTLSIVLLLLSVSITSAEEPWRFIVLADWHGAEKYTQSEKPSDEFAAAAARDVTSVSFLKKNIGGDLVLLPGDSNEGHWKRDTILELGRLCYGGMIDSFNKGGYTNLLMAVGDHELGDNPWPVNSEKAKSQELFRQAFAQAFNQTPEGAFKFSTPIGSASSRPVGTQYEKTSYAYQHKNVLFVTVDVFRIDDPGRQLGDQGSVTGSVEGKHLEWLDAVLGEGRKLPGIKHIVVQSHLPVIYPVRKVQSSGMLMDNDVDSDFWKTLRKHKVDVYFAGEVHANTVTKDPGSDLVQIVSRGNFFSNFLAVDVKDQGIKITCYGKQDEKDDNPYTTVGQLTLEKRQGGITAKGEGELAILDSSQALMHFDFEERFYLASRPGSGNGNAAAVRESIRIGEIQCTQAFANNGVFGSLFDSHFTKVGTVDGPRGKGGAFDAGSCMAVFGMGPHYLESPVSYALWLKTTSAEPMVLINSGSIWGKGTQNFMNLNLVGGKPEVQISKDQLLIANAVLSDGKWHHVAVSVTKSGAKLSETTIYVDGKPAECRLQGKDEVLKTNQAVCLSFGCFGYSRPVFGEMGIKPYTGALDEIKVWARGISENDIKSLIE